MSMVEIPRTARGVARLATEEEIAREESLYYIASDLGFIITTDSGIPLVPNTGDFGYTNPNLHRRVYTDLESESRPLDPYNKLRYSAPIAVTDEDNLLAETEEEVLASRYGTWNQMEAEGGSPEADYSDYLFVHYDENGHPYPQTVVLGVWDGVHSYRTTTTYTHDEESTTCEIP